MMDPSVLVVIINWQQPEVTLECIRAVQAMSGPATDLLLIDNGSGDGSVARFEKTLPTVELLSLPENIGFASAANHGLGRAAAAGYSYALLLNNDAFPAPDMLERLLAETAVDVALLSPKIYYEFTPDHIWFAGAKRHPILLEMRQTGKGKVDSPAWSQTKDVDYLVGTGLLVNLSTVAEVSFFDENYFMYYEDLDWSIRLRQAGYRLRLVADAHLYHRVSLSSGGVDSPAQRYHLARSSILFFRRHAHLGMPWMIFLFRLGSALKMITRLLIRRRLRVAVAYLRGLRDGWRASRDLI